MLGEDGAPGGGMAEHALGLVALPKSSFICTRMSSPRSMSAASSVAALL